MLVCGLAPAYADAPTVAAIEITSHLSSGAGSLRAALEAANASSHPVRIVSRLAEGTVVYVFREMPPLRGRGVELDAQGLILRGDDCVRNDGRRGCSGLVVSGEEIVVKDLAATGFLFDGISVRGAKTVHILKGRFFRNLDDGVGISEASKGVTVEACLLEANGFRSKGKGVLVFDHSQALLRANRLIGNRDGVTISKRSHAVLERNEIRDSYDKGLGITGASAEGVDNEVTGSGAGISPHGAGPNADGVRVTLDSRVRFENIRVRGSGDRGVVATGDSRTELVDSVVADNRGGDVEVSDRAVVVLNGRVWRAEAGPTRLRSAQRRSGGSRRP